MEAIKSTKADRDFFISALTNSNDFIDHYCDWSNDDVVTHYLFQGTFPVTRESASKLYDSYTESHENVVFGIYERRFNESNPLQPLMVLIGVCGIHDINWVSRIGEFRILIGDKDCWNLGLGKECLKLMTKLAFEKYNLHKLCLGFNSEHMAAQKAYSEAGFKHEYVVKEGHFRNGVYYDLIHMCLFKRDYQPK